MVSKFGQNVIIFKEKMKMKNLNFPIFKTKIKGLKREFDLSDPKERKKYFEAKAGKEIRKLRKYLQRNTFIAYLLGKKIAGKGTYSKLFKEIVAPNKAEHFSIGDMIRDIDKEISSKRGREKFVKFLKENYRGFTPLDEIMGALDNRSTKTLLPTELILTLVKRKILEMGKKALFIDGFPRNLDQISYSLFFRDLIDYREDPDVFILIDVPEAVIDERMKYRVVCPICHTPRNIKLFPTREIGYDKKKKEFYLKCDNPDCHGAKMLRKEGDELGIKNIKERLNLDEKLMKQALSLQGIPKILLRNSIPVKKAKQYVDNYEITPEYYYKWDEREKKVKILEKPWTFKDDNGNLSYSLLAPPVAVSLIKQMVKVLNL